MRKRTAKAFKKTRRFELLVFKFNSKASEKSSRGRLHSYEHGSLFSFELFATGLTSVEPLRIVGFSLCSNFCCLSVRSGCAQVFCHYVVGASNARQQP